MMAPGRCGMCPDPGSRAGDETLAVPVFVDHTGRRKRWIRLSGYLLALLCVVYIVLVALGLSGTRVGPMVGIPNSAGRPVIAGLTEAPIAPALPMAPSPQPSAAQLRNLEPPTEAEQG